MLVDISDLDKIYIVCGRTDMRKQIDGLCAIIEEKLQMYFDVYPVKITLSFKVFYV